MDYVFLGFHNTSLGCTWVWVLAFPSHFVSSPHAYACFLRGVIVSNKAAMVPGASIAQCVPSVPSALRPHFPSLYLLTPSTFLMGWGAYNRLFCINGQNRNLEVLNADNKF